MLRRRLLNAAALFVALALGLPAAHAAVWPAKWGEHTRSKAEPAVIADAGLWAEYEGEAAERVSFQSPIGPFRATAWRLRDSTSALAWYYFTRPANCTPVRNALSACTTPGMAAMSLNNYVLLFEGWRPLEREIAELEKSLPDIRSGGGLPKLPGYLPGKNLIRNSERYITGIESLNRFEPRISPMLVGFEDGVEAVTASFRSPSGDLSLTLLEYPTPQIARQRMTGFEHQSGWAVKRSGTLIAVIPQQVDASAAAAVLNEVQWDVNFMWNQATKAPPMPDVAGMLIAIFKLTGLLIIICIGGGILVAGLYYLSRSRQRSGEEDPMTWLKIS
jgi:hypothetical protein